MCISLLRVEPSNQWGIICSKSVENMWIVDLARWVNVLDLYNVRGAVLGEYRAQLINFACRIEEPVIDSASPAYIRRVANRVLPANQPSEFSALGFSSIIERLVLGKCAEIRALFELLESVLCVLCIAQRDGPCFYLASR